MSISQRRCTINAGAVRSLPHHKDIQSFWLNDSFHRGDSDFTSLVLTSLPEYELDEEYAVGLERRVHQSQPP